VDCVGSNVERTVGFEEVVQAHAELRCEVPDASVGGWAIIVDVVWLPAEGWVLVIGPDDTTAALRPGHDLAVAGAGKVPFEQDRRDGDSSKGSAHCVWSRADSGCGAQHALKFWRVGLPEREDFDAVLEVAMQKTGAEVRSENFAGAAAEHQELVAASVFSDSEAALREYADCERVTRRVEGRRRGWLRLRESKMGEREEGDRHGAGLCYASDDVNHSLFLSRLVVRQFRRKAADDRRPLKDGRPLELACDGCFVHIEVRVDILRVVEVFDRLE